MIPLTDKEKKYYENQKYVIYVKKGYVIIKNKKKCINYTEKL